MEIRFTPEFETKLNRIAAETGRGPEQLVRELVESYIDHEQWFRREVQQGLAQLDRGEFVPDEEVLARVERLFQR